MSILRALRPLLLLALATLAHAQAGRPPRIDGGAPLIQARNIAADFHLLRAGNAIYRYNGRTGETQVLVTKPQQIGIGFAWTSAVEASGAPPAGEPGRYQVAEGDNNVAPFVRIDTQFGTTWIGSLVNGALRWDVLAQ